MTAKSTDAAAEPIVTEATPVVDPTAAADEWVQVKHKSSGKDGATGLMPRAYFDGWGRDLGWQEVK